MVARDDFRERQNIARLFVERRAIGWIALVATVLWGAYSFLATPQRKDPNIPVRIAVAITPWPGVSAEKVEQLVTRPIEERIAQNNRVHPPGAATFGIKSLSLPGVSIVQVQLDERGTDTRKELSDIALKLNDLNRNLPQGAGPIQFNTDFGATAALMLTVASPAETPVAIALRAEPIARAIAAVRAAASSSANRASIVAVFSEQVSPALMLRTRDAVATRLQARGAVRDVRPLAGPGFIGLDVATALDDDRLAVAVREVIRDELGATRFQPDGWPPVVIRDPSTTEAKLAAVAGPRYTYRQLDQFTDLIARALEQVPAVATVQRSGVLPEQILLEYSQSRLAAYGLAPSSIKNILGARNSTVPGGVVSLRDVEVTVDPTGDFRSAREIGDVVVTTDASGNPVYLRDIVEIARLYQSPPQFLNWYTSRDAEGRWQRTPAITLAVQMRDGEQIAAFGRAVDARLAEVAQQLPPDLVVARTSDQPRQVRENIDLFMTALYEAILLVVLVAAIGFWEWRSAALMAVSIPVTLALTFAFTHLLGVELQQVSIATLIIALGLLVDDPVVAGDAIKRELGAGEPRGVAAWLGPTRLAHAILFATITNIVAYLPFLLLTGTTGDFLRSLPVVMTCALVASRIVSMTFVPLLGYYLLRAPARSDPPIEWRRSHGFTGLYYRVGLFVLEHRWKSFAVAMLLLVSGIVLAARLPTAFFPNDVQYLAYVDLWLPNASPVVRTDELAARAERIIRDEAERFGAERGGERAVLKSVTTFVGGGAPRFWYSLTPEQRQKNYAQLVVELSDKEDTPRLVERLRVSLAAALDGARAEVRELETNAVGIPIQIRVSGGDDSDPAHSRENVAELRAIADRVAAVFRGLPQATGFRDDWDQESFVVKLDVDADRANLAGLTNQDVAGSIAAGVNGNQVATLREGTKQIPVVSRLRLEERGRLDDLQSVYVFSSTGTQRAPLGAVATLGHDLETQRIRRTDHFRTITVQGFPVAGAYASEVMNAARPQLEVIAASLPPGYTIAIGGAEARQREGFRQLALLMAASVAGIFVALTIQFNSLVKPLLVFAAVPFGVVGALLALLVMGEPFGFMAFLGIASLVGVIVSHVIVLFDFIEENHAKGEPLIDSLLDAGIVRLRPVMITVGATMLALVPLAIHGGPLWRPLCYAQIGGLALATFIELLLVKVFYVIFVEDLKWIRWDERPRNDARALAPVPAGKGA